MMAVYETKYKELLEDLKRSSEGLVMQDEYRDRPVGREVTI